MGTIQVKMAKASQDDIDRCIKFFQFIENYMDHGIQVNEDETETELSDEDFLERLRERWGGRFRPAGVDCAWSRVVFGCDILIKNACDPESDVLEWKPEFAEKLRETEVQ